MQTPGTRRSVKRPSPMRTLSPHASGELAYGRTGMAPAACQRVRLSDVLTMWTPTSSSEARTRGWALRGRSLAVLRMKSSVAPAGQCCSCAATCDRRRHF